MKIQAPAKINIYLKVLGRRADGYHELRTIMVPLSLFDEISIEPAGQGIMLDAPGCNCASENNLVHKAARLFLESTGVRSGVSIRVRKHIPVGAGLGGGSSDAASVLAGLNDLFRTGLGPRDLMAMAGNLGADCPFFILGRPSLMGARGDEVLRDIHLEDREYLLVIPPIALSTAQVYAELKSPLTTVTDRLKIDSVGRVTIAPEQWLVNDLEAAAFGICPELKLVKAELLEAGALGALMTGSGSSVFGVFKDRDHLCYGISRLRRRDGYSYIPTARLTGERYGDNRS